MPQVILRIASENKYARIETTKSGTLIRLGPMEEATRFADATQAEQGFSQALENMKSAASAKAKKINQAAGGKVFSGHDLPWRNHDIRERWTEACKKVHPETKKKRLAEVFPGLQDYHKRNYAETKKLSEKFERFGWAHVPMKAIDFYPVWMTVTENHKPVFETVTSIDDLLDPMEIWFARIPQGWLFSQGRSSHVVTELSHATPFFSQEAAQSAIRAAGWRDPVFCKASMVFSKVLAPKNFKLGNDAISSALSAGCEAREIDSEIRHATESRKSAIQEQARSASPKPRL